MKRKKERKRERLRERRETEEGKEGKRVKERDGGREGDKGKEGRKEVRKGRREGRMYEAYQELCQVSGFSNLKCMNAMPLKLRCIVRTIWLGHGVVNLAKKRSHLPNVISRVGPGLCSTPVKL